MERFIKEYANYQKSTLASFELMKPEFKKMVEDVIDGGLKARERNLITVDETMKMIADPFSYLLNEN